MRRRGRDGIQSPHQVDAAAKGFLCVLAFVEIKSVQRVLRRFRRHYNLRAKDDVPMYVSI